MALHRRHLLTALGTTGVAALAGCPRRGGNESTPETAPPSLSEDITKLARGDGVSHDFFGGSVAMAADGTTAIVGATYNEIPNGDDAGAAHAFHRAGGSWPHQAKLTAADGDAYDFFGSSVAVAADGTTAIVGAYRDEDPNGWKTGSAYVFERAGETWHQQAKLAPPDGDGGVEFGDSVAVAADGTTALVGAAEDGHPNSEDAGAAYVFDAAGDSWTQQAKLAAADGDANDFFGSSVAVAADGTTALIGARQDENPNGEEAGATYVFKRSGGSWTQQAKFAAADGDSEDTFGWSVAVAADGTTALVGAPDDEDPNGKAAGSAYVFQRAGDAWTQQAKLVPPDGDAGDTFGESVAVAADGSTALIGAEDDEDPKGENVGAAYVFDAAGGSWTQQTKLAPADDASDDYDYFGASVAMATDATTAFVGAPGDEDPNSETEGSAYIFEQSGGSWPQ